MLCPDCFQFCEAGAFHMCPQPIAELDRRDRLTKAREWLLEWCRLQIQIHIGMLGLTLQIRQYMHATQGLHLAAVVLSFGSRQLGFVLERITGFRPANLRLRLHTIRWYHEFYF